MIQPIRYVFTNWRNPQHKTQGDPMQHSFYIPGSTPWRLEFKGYGSVSLIDLEGGSTIQKYQGNWSFPAVERQRQYIVKFRSNLQYLRIFIFNEGEEVMIYEYQE